MTSDSVTNDGRAQVLADHHKLPMLGLEPDRATRDLVQD